MTDRVGRVIKVHAGNKLVGEFRSSGDDQKDMETFDRMLREAGHKHAPISPIMRTWNQARSFATVANDLFETVMQLRGESGEYAAPFVVNAAFGIEIYLKAIAQSQGLALRGHALLDLYDELPDVARSSILANVSEISERFDLDDHQPIDVRAFLAGLNNAFTAWRYKHEGKADGTFIGGTQALFLLDLLEAAMSSLLATEDNTKGPP